MIQLARALDRRLKKETSTMNNTTEFETTGGADSLSISANTATSTAKHNVRTTSGDTMLT
eukprot:Awhi_evm1s9524